ncbi:MAG TPA: NAD-dependent epimerase/dehydratase family protein [Solirubrobacteraceae bacterium]|nr:NAD-dependent epimerase/dehydratase family protein [Solirubrobacteraceae bacterium]
MSDTCLITGATGFIGGHLARRLLHEGYAVRCLVRPSSDTSQLEQLDVQLAIGDLTRADSLVSAVEGCQYVVHCGALVSDWATAQEIDRINVGGTRNLLEAAVAAAVKRFVHLSSTDVYGYPDRAQTDETYTATSFRNWYAQTKLEAEAEVHRAQAEHALTSVILRPATVYGPGSLDVVGEIARAIKAHHMLLIDRGRPIAGVCYVENLLDAAVLALQHDAAPGEAFNVSDGLPITWKQFTDGLADGLDCPGVRFSLPYWLANSIGFTLEHGYRLLRRATGLSLPPLLSRQAVQVLGKSQDFSNRKLRQMLGWEPRVDYQSGLAATIEWLKNDHLST